MQQRDPVVLAWLLGLGLAAVVYLIGPGDVLFRIMDGLHLAAWRLGELIADLSHMALDVVRALAIGLYVTFVVLALAVMRRGGSARGALAGVTLLLFVLVGGDDWLAQSNTRWTAALALSAVGAAVMTGRLRQPPLPTTRF